MMNIMKAFMYDELGDLVQIDEYPFPDIEGIDEDFMEVWQERKAAQLRERFPEAQSFFFEDDRKWERAVNQARYEEYLDTLDPDDCDNWAELENAGWIKVDWDNDTWEWA